MSNKSLLMIALTFGISNAYSANHNTCGNYNNNKCFYNPNVAKKYALNQVYENDQNKYFNDYTNNGGNCTNFVNQAILAGLIGSTSPKKLYDTRSSYYADYYGYSPYRWYFAGKNNSSSSWRGATALETYAIKNKNPSYKGLHFKFITRDSKTKPLNFKKIKVGDIIFADWEGDNDVDHSMIVTGKNYNGYSGIYVTYQSSAGTVPKKNRALNIINKPNIIFHVYRPTFYSDYGY